MANGTEAISKVGIFRRNLLNMILVLLGTFYIEFPRPIIAIEKLLQEGKLSEEVIVQNGYTQYQSDQLKLQPFLDHDTLDRLYRDARIIITHAGTGSIMKGVKMGKKMISVPRLYKYGEHIDDHQIEIHNEFVKMGYIYPWNENDSLEEILKEINNFVPNKYVSNKQEIISYLKTFIDSL